MKFSYSLIKKLVPRAPTKKAVVEALNLHSFEAEDSRGDLLEISLPPNRYSDASGHVGVAREVSAIFGKVLENPERTIVNLPRGKGYLTVDVKEKKRCPRYAAAYLELSPSTRSGRRKVGASPAWLKKILKTCGIKSVNYIVDVMNYVMLETGQPLHAFDASKLRNAKPRIRANVVNKKTIIVRRSKKGERIETLDGQRFILDADTLVIADAKRPLAIAGIKGGQNSGVDKKTRAIIVEAANFDSVGIFKTARSLKLNTDAAVRFSHGMSPALVETGLNRAIQILTKGGARLMDVVDIYPRRVSEEVIPFSTEHYARLMGGSVTDQEAQRYLKRLGFTIKGARRSGSFVVHVPPWRVDIQNSEDLIEEVGRLKGYEKLESASPQMHLRSAEEDNRVVFKDLIRDILVRIGFDEVYNYSFVPESECGKQNFLGWHTTELENPLSSELACLRSTLEQGISKNLAGNTRYFEAPRVFELGTAFGWDRGGVMRERMMLGIGIASKSDERIVRELKGVVDELMRGIGIVSYSLKASGDSLRVEVDKSVIGIIKGMPKVSKRWHAAFAEIDVEKLLSLVEGEKSYEPLPKFPSVMRDVSLLVNSSVRIGNILIAIQKSSPKLIDDVDLVDEYVFEGGGKSPSPVGFGGPRTSLTFRIVFLSRVRTLTDKEVDKEMKKITFVLRRKFRAEIR